MAFRIQLQEGPVARAGMVEQQIIFKINIYGILSKNK